MSGQNIHIMNIIKCFVVCQQILLIYTKCTLTSYTDQTSDSASFRILSVEGVNHLCSTHIIYINTYIQMVAVIRFLMQIRWQVICWIK